MDDARTQTAKRSVSRAARFVVAARWLFVVLVVLGSAGCSLFLLAGKVFFGDPVVPGAFQQATGIDLLEEETNVIVLCSAPSMVEGGELSLNYEIVEAVSRQLKREGVSLVDSNDVRTWMDDNGGRLDDPRDLAEDFDVDYIIYISLARVTFHEENSPTLFRGNASGEVFAFEVNDNDGDVMVNEVFSKGFNSTYPSFNPISADQVDSPRIFKKRFLDRVSVQLAHLFYSHKVSEEIH